MANIIKPRKHHKHLLSMWLLNLKATETTLLLYPPGIDVIPPLLIHKNSLNKLSSEWVGLFFLFPQLTYN